MSLYPWYKVLNRLGQIARAMSIGHAQARKTSETRQIFWAHKFCFVKEKSLDLQIYSRIGKAMKKVIVNYKYYRENQYTCDILMFIYTMVSNLLYLLIDWDACNYFITEVPII